MKISRGRARVSGGSLSRIRTYSTGSRNSDYPYPPLPQARKALQSSGESDYLHGKKAILGYLDELLKEQKTRPH
jgi:hypothetical protein